eukprot:jgi/Bigna1/67820/fgenesh1_pg.4_\
MAQLVRFQSQLTLRNQILTLSRRNLRALFSSLLSPSSRTLDRPQKGMVQTVNGSISPESVGPTLMHEHLVVDYSQNWGCMDDIPGDPALKGTKEEIRLWESKMTMVLEGDENVIEDVNRFKSTEGHPGKLKDISSKTGLHVVMGTGWYLARTHPKDMTTRSSKALEDKLIADLTGTGEDCEDGICAGYIGELGCTTELHPNERRVLQAAARVSRDLGVFISIHPGYSRESPFHILNELSTHGADLSRVVMGHVDRGILKMEDYRRIADTGCVLDFDRCHQIKELADLGYQEQIVAGHDIAFKIRLSKFGGHSYDYAWKYVTQYMKKIDGGNENLIKVAIFVDNPKRLLTVV